MNEMGVTTYRGVKFNFAFDGEELDLYPYEGQEDAAMSLVDGCDANGIWFGGDFTLETEEDCLVLDSKSTGNKLVLFFDSSAWWRPDPFMHFSLQMPIGRYFVLRRKPWTVNRLSCASPLLNHLLDTYSKMVEKDEPEGRSINASISSYLDEVGSFKLDDVVVTVRVGAGFSIGPRHIDDGIARANPQILFNFDETDDWAFVDKLAHIARNLLRLSCYSLDVGFTSVTLHHDYETGFDEAAKTTSIEVGAFEVREDVPVVRHEMINKKGRFLPWGRVPAVVPALLQRLSDGTLSLNELPNSQDDRTSYNSMRILALATAFDWEFAELYPDGVRHSESALKAKRNVLEIIDGVLESGDGRLNSRTKSEIRRLKGIVENGDSFSDMVNQVEKDHPDLLAAIGREAYEKNDVAYEPRVAAERIRSLRNALAHGNVSYEFSNLTVCDTLFLERVLVAMRLLGVDGLDEKAIAELVKKMFG